MLIWKKLAEGMKKFDPNKEKLDALTKKIQRRKDNIKKIQGIDRVQRS